MIKAIDRYKRYLEELLLSENKHINWTEVIAEHDRQTGYFQAERLIHLIVTMFVSLFTLLSFFTSFFIGRLEIYLLTIILIILALAYLYHYFRLENGVQSLYSLTDKLHKRIQES